MNGFAVRVRGQVQGVGFRPAVLRIALGLGLVGDVLNDGEGVEVRLFCPRDGVERFIARLREGCPPLARIDEVEVRPIRGEPPDRFRIAESRAGGAETGITPDAATCSACRGELLDPADRRYRYPFINCTHCGPRLTIVEGIPYDRDKTSMRHFPMCEACAREYGDPLDRRFHAQPNACPVCGPQVTLLDRRGNGVSVDDGSDGVDQAAALLAGGSILAVKGVGGFHLACDAANAETVARLRRRKRRHAKPFALMAGNREVIEGYAWLDEESWRAMSSPAAPVAILPRRDSGGDGGRAIASEVAPNQDTLGFMLPYSPLHILLFEGLLARGWDVPLVMTSGNLSHEPQCISDDEAVEKLAGIADYFLVHDRPIVNRVDDSVVRVMDGEARFYRRARGYAPAAIPLPPGLAGRHSLLAMGGELKNTFCLVKKQQAVLSQHIGDLEDVATFDDWRGMLELYADLYRHQPECILVDAHPGYRATRFGLELAKRHGLGVVRVQHHHAHIAACMAEHGVPADAGPVLGIALDGLGYGEDGHLWGGELLLAEYGGYRRLASLAEMPMIGGNQAALEPWRCIYAQLRRLPDFPAILEAYRELPLFRVLNRRPLEMAEGMLARGVNCPMTSSAGRLFDAAAALLGICRERIDFEGEAAIRLEGLARRGLGGLANFKGEEALWIDEAGRIDPGRWWLEALDELARGVEPSLLAARFHHIFARSVSARALQLCHEHRLGRVALSGGVWQNRLLLEWTCEALRSEGIEVLTPRLLPANDGCIAYGQAVVGLARLAGRGG